MGWSGFGSMPLPALPRPGMELPPHWPTSPRSRHRSFRQRTGALEHATQSRKAQVLQSTMRHRRQARHRERDMEAYRQAFAAIDDDGSGRVDPAEIVKLAAKIGKRIDTVGFWRIFNELDIDKSAGVHARAADLSNMCSIEPKPFSASPAACERRYGLWRVHVGDGPHGSPAAARLYR